MSLNDGPSRIRLCSDCSARSACQVHRKVRSVSYVVHKISCLSLRRSTRVWALFSIAASVTRQSPRAVAPAVHWNIDPTRELLRWLRAGSRAPCAQRCVPVVLHCTAGRHWSGASGRAALLLAGLPGQSRSYVRTRRVCVRCDGRPTGRPRPTHGGAAPTVTLGRPGTRRPAGRPPFRFSPCGPLRLAGRGASPAQCAASGQVAGGAATGGDIRRQ